jgi:hypothetical protein
MIQSFNCWSDHFSQTPALLEMHRHQAISADMLSMQLTVRNVSVQAAVLIHIYFEKCYLYPTSALEIRILSQELTNWITY